MADVLLVCPKCKSEMKISEYRSDKDVDCASCGAPIAIPERKKPAGGLRLKPPAPRQPSAKEQAPAIDLENSASNVSSLIKSRDAGLRKGARSSGLKASVVSWLVFFALGGVLAYFRFIGQIPVISKEAFIQYGLIAVAACYALAVVLAIRDNMFDGLLSIVVPLYPFYYILMVSNLVFVRAVIMAVLAAFGYDAALQLQEWWQLVYERVSCWIENA